MQRTVTSHLDLTLDGPSKLVFSVAVAAGVPLATVQRILRHSDPAITTEVYGHLDVEDMRKGFTQFGSPLEHEPHVRGDVLAPHCVFSNTLALKEIWT